MIHVNIPNERGEPGKYDAECTEVFEKLNPDAVLLIVCGGPKGSGFSVALKDLRLLRAMAAAMHAAAADIERACQQ